MNPPKPPPKPQEFPVRSSQTTNGSKPGEQTILQGIGSILWTSVVRSIMPILIFLSMAAVMEYSVAGSFCLGLFYLTLIFTIAEYCKGKP